MKKTFIILLLISLSSCGIYNLTGSSGIDAKTFQVNNFQNNALLIEPGIDRAFTQKLQNLIMNQTSLSLTNSDGDLVYEGEITDYRISPMAAAADQTASQNRLTINVKVRFTNKKKEADNFEKSFSFYHDYPGNKILAGSALNDAVAEIFERIAQDVFNDSLAKW